MKALCLLIILSLAMVPAAAQQRDTGAQRQTGARRDMGEQTEIGIRQNAVQRRVTELERRLARTKPEKLRLKRMVSLAEALEQIHVGKARGQAVEAITLASARGDSAALGRALLVAGMSSIRAGSADSGLALLRRADTIAIAIRDTALLCANSYRLARCLSSLGIYAKAKEYLRRGQRLVAIVNDAGERCRLLLQELQIATRTGRDPALTDSLLSEAMSIAHSLGHPGLLASAHFSAGSRFRAQGNDEEAFSEHAEARRIYASLGWRVSEAGALSSLGMILAVLRKSEDALRYLDSAAVLLKETGNIYSMPYTLNSLAFVHLNLGEYDRAVAVFERSREYAIRFGIVQMDAHTCNLIGLSFRKSARHMEAKHWNMRALELYRQLGSRSDIVKELTAFSELHMIRGEYDSAVAYIREAVLIAEQHGSGSELIDCFISLGNVLVQAGRFADAHESFATALATAEKLRDRRGIGRAHIGLARVSAYLDDWCEAVVHEEKALTELEAVNDRRILVETLRAMADYHLSTGLYRKGLQYAEKELRVAEELVDSVYILHASYQIAEALLYFDRDREAMAVVVRAIPMAIAMRDSVRLQNLEHWLGNIYHNLGLLDDALAVYTRLLGAESSPGDPLLSIDIGRLLIRLRRFPEARAMLESAEAIASKVGDNSVMKFIQISLGVCHQRLGDPDAALSHLHMGMELCRQEQDTYNLSDALLCIGDIRNEQGDDDAAEKAFRQALALAESEEYKFRQGEILGELGELYLARRDFALALDHLHRALAISEETGYAKGIAWWRAAAMVYAHTGAWKKACAYLAHANAWNDSLRNESRNLRFVALQTKFDGERKEHEIRLLEAQRVLDAAAMQRRQDSLALMDLELKNRQTDLQLRISAADELRRRNALLERERDIRIHELARRSAERTAHLAATAAAELGARRLRREAAYTASLAVRVQRTRNAMMIGFGLLLVVGVLGIRRIHDHRAAASLRAEMSENNARAVEARAVAQSAETVRREKDAQRRFSRRLIASQEEERKRISAELHDSISQYLIVIRNHAAMALDAAAPPVQVVTKLEEIAALAAVALDDVRRISRDLRPYMIDQIGLTETLRSTVGKAAASSGLRLEMRIENIDGLLAREDEMRLFRLVQEGMNNILKHAQATTALVELRREGNAVLLRIEDDGRGFVPPAQRQRTGDGEKSANGLGLRSMAERIEMMHGTLTLRTAPGQGTAYAIRIPLSAERREVPGVRRAPAIRKGVSP